MVYLILSLCYVRALPEAFSLMKSAVVPQTCQARVSAEVSAGHWSLFA